jgi:hypothetical protein
MQTQNIASIQRRRALKLKESGPDSSDCDGFPLSRSMDIYGNKRTPANEEPVHWAAPRTTFELSGVVPNGNNDHDRLLMGDWDKYNAVSMRLFGDVSQMWWDRRTPEQVQEFLRQYWDDPELILVKIQKMYNISNGFPVWNFSYRLSKL